MTRSQTCSPEKGAETVACLASSSTVEGVTGEYFANRKAKKSNPSSSDGELTERLWQVNADLVGGADVAEPKGTRMGTQTTRPTMATQGDWTKVARQIWLWPVSILIGLPIGGYVADLVVDGVDSVGAALAAGLIAGMIIGAAEWFVLRRRVSWLWIPATTAGMAVGLAAGAALVDFGIDRGDLALMGAVAGLGVGVMQTLVLARHQIPGAFWWAIANPPGWALGWFVSSYVIARNIAERFPIFGASGALVFGLLTWLVLAVLFRDTSLEGERTPAPASP